MGKEELDLLLKELDSSIVQHKIGVLAEEAISQYLKRLAAPVLLVAGILGFLGYDQLQDISTQVDRSKEEINYRVQRMETDVRDRAQAITDQSERVTGNLRELSSTVASTGTNFTNSARTYEERAEELSQRSQDLEREFGESERMLVQARVQNTQSMTTALATHRETMTYVTRLQEALGNAGQVEVLQARADEATMNLQTLQMETNKVKTEAERLTGQLEDVKSILRAVEKARILQIVLLESHGRATRTISLPRLAENGEPTEGGEPLEMTFLTPGDIDDTFDLQIIIGTQGVPGHEEIGPIRGLAKGAISAISNTGYEFVVEFIYHHWLAHDFAVLRVTPR